MELLHPRKKPTVPNRPNCLFRTNMESSINTVTYAEKVLLRKKQIVLEKIDEEFDRRDADYGV